MARSGVRITGLRRVRKNLKKLGKLGINAFRGAMYVEGLHVIGKAVENAPAVTGRLRDSHWVSHPDRQGEVTIGFAAIYAAAVEAGLKLSGAARKVQRAAFASMRESGWSKSTVGGPHYFAKAIDETASGRVARVSRRARRYFERGVGFTPFPGKPKSEREGRARSES